MSEYIKGRSSRTLYEQYTGRHGTESNNTAHFEHTELFRHDLSRYNYKTNVTEIGEACRWDKQNCSGIPIDYDKANGVMYVDGSDAHTLLIGSTGSKKSRLVVMPTVRILTSSNENMIICDPKGEIYNRSSGFLNEQEYNIHAINFRDPEKGDGWNMLSVPYQLYYGGEIDKACEFVNDMTINLIPLTAKDPYWDYSARDVLFGLIILLFKISKELSLEDKIVNMQNVLRLKEELFCSSYSNEIMKTHLWEIAKTDNLIRMRLNGTVICPEKTLSCIISTFDQHMSCFLLQPKVMSMLCETTFDIHDFGFDKNAIFIIMPDEKTTFHKIVAIFIKQIYEILIDNAYKKTKSNRFPSRINFVLDEFSSLPTISDFPQMISASRSRNIRFLLIVQSKHQLKQRYEEETETIMSNCSNWMFLTSREIELLREVSELSGTTGQYRDPLISISRLQHLNKDIGECLIFNGRKYPYLAHLPDIDVYDGGSHTEFQILSKVSGDGSELPINFFTEQVRDYLSHGNRHNDSSKEKLKKPDDSVEYDLQNELEAKFDELFGSISDDDNPPNC